MCIKKRAGVSPSNLDLRNMHECHLVFGKWVMKRYIVKEPAKVRVVYKTVIK